MRAFLAALGYVSDERRGTAILKSRSSRGGQVVLTVSRLWCRCSTNSMQRRSVACYQCFDHALSNIAMSMREVHVITTSWDAHFLVA